MQLGAGILAVHPVSRLTNCLQMVRKATDVLALVFALAPRAVAQEGESRPLRVTVSIGKLVAVSDPIDVDVGLTNISVNRRVIISHVMLVLPSTFAVGGRDREYDLIEDTKPFELLPAASWRPSTTIHHLTFPHGILGLLRYRCTETRIMVRIIYKDEPIHRAPVDLGGTVADEITEQVKVQPRSAMWAVVVGGAAGVALVTVLSFLRGVQQNEGMRINLRSQVKSRVLTMLYGSVATAVAIVLLNATTVSDFPVAVDVRDALGGLIMGLFFKPVGDFMQAKISS